MTFDPVIVTGVLSLVGTGLVAWLGFLNARLSTAKTSEQALIDRLEKRIDQLDRTIANQDTKLALLEQKNDALEKENDSLKERVRVLERDGAAAEHLGARLTTANKLLIEQKDALNRENAELHSQLATVAICQGQDCPMRDLARQMTDGGKTP